jgi:hypothetical protein
LAISLTADGPLGPLWPEGALRSRASPAPGQHGPT